MDPRGGGAKKGPATPRPLFMPPWAQVLRCVTELLTQLANRGYDGKMAIPHSRQRIHLIQPQNKSTRYLVRPSLQGLSLCAQDRKMLRKKCKSRTQRVSQMFSRGHVCLWFVAEGVGAAQWVRFTEGRKISPNIISSHTLAYFFCGLRIA